MYARGAIFFPAVGVDTTRLVGISDDPPTQTPN
jgi:hypothetical protein